MNITLDIKGMHCPSCEILIKEGIEELPGITNISINRAKNQATINFDEKQTNLEAIKKAIKKEGYDSK